MGAILMFSFALGLAMLAAVNLWLALAPRPSEFDRAPDGSLAH